MSAYDRLQTLGIQLPSAATPGGAYVNHARVGNLLFVSGHIARVNGKAHVGRLGADLGTEAGQAAARSIAIDLLATLEAAAKAAGGNLDDVRRIVKIVGLVNCTPDFAEAHLVTNGCSELLVAVFGERGMHARSAFGVSQLPMGACVEVELVAELDVKSIAGAGSDE